MKKKIRLKVGNVIIAKKTTMITEKGTEFIVKEISKSNITYAEYNKLQRKYPHLRKFLNNLRSRIKRNLNDFVIIEDKDGLQVVCYKFGIVRDFLLKN